MDNSNIRQEQEFAGPTVGSYHNTTPDIRHHSSLIEYSKLFLTVFGHFIIGRIKFVLPSALHPASN
jgi:hypothetical protein